MRAKNVCADYHLGGTVLERAVMEKYLFIDHTFSNSMQAKQIKSYLVSTTLVPGLLFSCLFTGSDPQNIYFLKAEVLRNKIYYLQILVSGKKRRGGLTFRIFSPFLKNI